MNTSLLPMLVMTLAFAVSAMAQEPSDHCRPGVNCRLPYCRCWDDPIRPGNFSNDGTPQIVSVTFSQAINKHTLSMYMPLFDNLVNPNDCPARGTFFAQGLDTDVDSLRYLYKEGHEVALTSSDGRIPKGKRQWADSLYEAYQKLKIAGIKLQEVRGARAPSLNMGGDDELQAEAELGMIYEASCVIPLDAVNGKGQMLWPYTYDYLKNTPRCELGKLPNQTFNGMWQFLIPEMALGPHRCSTLSGCSPYINTTADAFILLYNSFIRHYLQGRAPMTLFVDAQWLSRRVQRQGLRQFLEVLSRFEDTWLVRLDQALAWVRRPVPMYKTVRFLPWECSKETKMNYAKYNKRR